MRDRVRSPLTCTTGGVADYSGVTYEKITQQFGVFWPCYSEDPKTGERIDDLNTGLFRYLVRIERTGKSGAGVVWARSAEVCLRARLGPWLIRRARAIPPWGRFRSPSPVPIMCFRLSRRNKYRGLRLTDGAA